MKIFTKARRSGAVSQRERDNLQVAYEAACEGIVLLKNDGALPFSTKRVALYGSGISMTIKGGTGSDIRQQRADRASACRQLSAAVGCTHRRNEH